MRLLTSFATLTSVNALDGVMSFLRNKTLQVHVKIFNTVQLLSGILQCNGRNWKRLKTSNVFRHLLCVRIKIDPL